LSKPAAWREGILRDIVQREVGERKWQMTLAQLSHTPMTKEAGRHYEKNVKEIDRHFNKLLHKMERSTAEWRREMRKPIVSSSSVILEAGEEDVYGLRA